MAVPPARVKPVIKPSITKTEFVPFGFGLGNELCFGKH